MTNASVSGSAAPDRFVRIVEEGPREGFQTEATVIATADKIALIEALADAGLGEINCASFTNRQQMPQMADAEAIFAGLARRGGVRYTGLWLNLKGFERARASGADLVATLATSASETFGLRNNQRDRAGMLEAQRALGAAYVGAGLTRATGYVFTAFGCNFEGAIPASQVVSSVSDLLQVGQECGIGYDAMVLCDTIGAGTPASVRAALGAVRSRWPALELALHLHDTRGLGLANALEGLRLGVRRFDTSVAGLGGCPFAGNRGAAGNVCTEDFAYLCAQEGYETGLDLERLIACASLAERIVGHPLPGKLKNAGPFGRHATRSSPSTLPVSCRPAA